MESLNAEITSLLDAAAESEIGHAEATKLGVGSSSGRSRRSGGDGAATGSRASARMSAVIRRTPSGALRSSTSRRRSSHANVIGQAKGVLMVAMRCTADEAFAVMVRQSQHENRKVVDVAAKMSCAAQLATSLPGLCTRDTNGLTELPRTPAAHRPTHRRENGERRSVSSGTVNLAPTGSAASTSRPRSVDRRKTTPPRLPLWGRRRVRQKRLHRQADRWAHAG